MQKGSIMPLVTFIGLGLIVALTYVWYVYTPVLIDKTALPQRQGVESEFTYWEKKTDMPTARTALTAVALEDKIYAMGGFNGVSKTLRTVEVYDPQEDTWSSAPDMPAGRYNAAAVVYQGKIYVIGGYEGLGKVPQNNIYVYDPTLKTWEELAPLPKERADHGAVVLNNYLYVVGGVTSNGLTSDFLRYNFVTKEWSELPNIPTGRDSMAIAATDNQILVAGGRANSSRKNLSSLEIFTVFPEATPIPLSEEGLSTVIPPVGEWSKGPLLSTERGAVAGAQLGHAIIVSGGQKLIGTFSEVEAYDVRTKKWHPFPSLNYSRQGAASVVVGNTLYVIGGGRHGGLSVSNIVESLNVETR